MGQRPTRMPRFAYSASADLVEPISSVADDGFPAAYRPPAQWFNYLFHYALAWSDYLRGPGWGAWTRAAHGGSAATFTSITGLAVDTDDTRARQQRYRYAITGAASGPVAKIAVSKNGLTWQDRAVPTGADALHGIARCGVYWITWGLVGSTATTWKTPVHDGSSSSGIGTNDATYWSLVSELAYPVRGVSSSGSDHVVGLRDSSAGSYRISYSRDDGTNWSASSSFGWINVTDRLTGVAYDDSRLRFLVVSMLGEVRSLPGFDTWPTGGSGLGSVSGIPTDARVQLVVGGPSDERTLLAWASYREDGTTALAATLLWRSTDGGTTWSAITPPTAWGATITDIAHVDGTWIATQSAAPYLWRSDDDGQNWERLPLPVAEESSWALHRAVYADGQIVATGLTWTVYSSRASATSPGTWTSREPVYLADAGFLRGRTIATTAPTSGQVYTWNSGTSQWEPTSASAFTVTTTRGDLIVRGASADQRLAVGASGRYMRSDGTDPSWQLLAASDLTGAPWSSIVPHTEVETNDATPTTVAMVATASNRSYTLDLRVTSTRSPAAVVAWKLLATVHSDGGGTLTLNDVLVTGPTDGGTSGLAVTVDTSGSNIRVRVTGIVATVTWAVKGVVDAMEN